jgi:hypothetical protein
VYSRRCELPCGQRFGGGLSLRQKPSACQDHSWGHPIPSPSRADLQRAVGGFCTSPRPITGVLPADAPSLALLCRRRRRRVPHSAPHPRSPLPPRCGQGPPVEATSRSRRHLDNARTPGPNALGGGGLGSLSHSPTRTFISPWAGAAGQVASTLLISSHHRPQEPTAQSPSITHARGASSAPQTLPGSTLPMPRLSS